MSEPGDQASERDALLALLSFAAGATDVMSFLTLGKIFTSAMTGNTALLMMSVGVGDWPAASRALTALIGFAAGVALAAALSSAWKASLAPRRLLRRLLLLELVFLAVGAAVWSAIASSPPGVLLHAVIVLSAFSMGMQAIGARGIDGSGISTIVFTSVLIRIVGRLTNWLAHGETPAGPGPDFGTFAAYAGGALIAGLSAATFRAFLIWLPVAAVAIALALSTRGGSALRRG